MSDPVINPEQEFEDQIEQELDKFYPDWRESEEKRVRAVCNLMNNFRDAFPGKETQSYKWNIIIGHNWTNITKGERIKTSPGLSEASKAETLREHTEKFLQTTPRKFQEELLEAATEAGIDVEEIQQIVDEHNSGKYMSDATYTKYFFPIYKKMRLKGYSRNELFRALD